MYGGRYGCGYMTGTYGNRSDMSEYYGPNVRVSGYPQSGVYPLYGESGQGYDLYDY